MKDLFFEMNGVRGVVSVSDDSGEAIVNGRKWRWDWHNYLGPTFINKDGSSRKRCPGVNHPIWKAIERWEKRRRKVKQ